MAGMRFELLGPVRALRAEGGLEAITHQAVVVRAGVGRATVYRHWPHLLDLRLSALADGMPPLPPAPADPQVSAEVDPRAELAHYLRTLATRLADPETGP